MELPPEDLELVHALQIAPRASWTQLGAALGRHPTTLAARWDRLRADGRSWVTAHLGTSGTQGCATFIGLECRPGRRAEVLERLCAVPEIGTVEESARAWDVRLTVLTRSWEQMTRDVLPLVRADPAILRAQLTVATRLHAIGSNWRLDVLSPEQQRRVSALRSEAHRPHGAVPAHLEEMTAVLQADGRATAAQIAAATGTHPTTAARHLHQALETGRIDRTLPFIRREGLKALTGDWPSQAAARAGIKDALLAFYGKERPEVLAGRTRHHLMPSRPEPDAIRLHRDVADAVRSGDPAGAGAAMREILREADAAMRAGVARAPGPRL